MTHRRHHFRSHATGSCRRERFGDDYRYEDEYFERCYGDYVPARPLSRDPIRGRLGGVCAGIARRFGWRPSIVRLLTIIGLFIVPHVVIIGYILLYAVLDERL